MAVLIVEDSRFMLATIRDRIEQAGFTTITAVSLKETRAILENNDKKITCALLDLHLPDSPDGEVIELVVNKNIPSVVFSAMFSPELRERFVRKGIVDYILKDSKNNLEYAVNIIKRLHKNPGIKILIVDDLKTTRSALARLLQKHLYQTIEAADGYEAKELIEQNPDIKLVLADQNMPNLTGLGLVDFIRSVHPADRMAVIGMSSNANGMASVAFLKRGANDYMVKPFMDEELICRINQAIETLELLELERKVTITDLLTGLSNRNHLFTEGEKRLKRARQVIVALVDIDNFKNINDTYGHVVGDLVLKNFAEAVGTVFSEKEMVARLGNDNFCILLVNTELSKVTQKLEDLRREVEAATIKHKDSTLTTTISIGADTVYCENIDDAIRAVEPFLLEASKNGGNQIKLGDNQTEQ